MPDGDAEAKILEKVYEDVNELYTDEHLITMQADLLEQMNTILYSLNELTRDRELVIGRNRQKKLDARNVDPDSFPINDLSVQLFEEYDSVYDLDRTLRKRCEARVGHYLRVKESSIEHHEAGQGVFVSCKRQKTVLPGTLLGLFPGVVCDPDFPLPQTPTA